MAWSKRKEHRRKTGASDPALGAEMVSRRQKLVVWGGWDVAESGGRMEWRDLSVASERALWVEDGCG